MKRFRKFIAIAVASVMVMVPMTAMASGAAGQTVQGTSIVEWDNSVAPKDIIKVILPTISGGTYNFTLDPYGLLYEYNPYHATLNPTGFPEGLVNGSGTANNAAVYMANSVDAGVTGKANADTDDDKLYKVYYEEDLLYADILGDIVLVTGTGAVDTLADRYAIWVPHRTGSAPDFVRNGEGEFLPLTAGNLATYFDIVPDTNDVEAASMEPVLLDRTEVGNGVVFDGNVYKLVVEEFDDPEELLKYVEIDANGDIIGTKIDIFVKLDGTSGLLEEHYITVEDAIANLTAVNDYDDVMDYDEGTVEWGFESPEVTVINRSTIDITVGVELKIVDDTGKLTFAAEAAGGADWDDEEMVFFAIKSGADVEAAERAEDANNDPLNYAIAELTFDLTAQPFGSTTYQSAEINPITLGRNYYQWRSYLSPYDFTEASFSIIADANMEDGNKAAWDAYVIAGLAEEEIEMPYIEVVYTVTTTDGDAINDDGDGVIDTIVDADFMFMSGMLTANPGFFVTIDESSPNISSVGAVSNVGLQRGSGTVNTVPSNMMSIDTGWLFIPWEASRVAFGFDWEEGMNFTITFTYGGVKYKATGIPTI